MRLTKKYNGTYDLPTCKTQLTCYYSLIDLDKTFTKLGQYEDVDEELGIDLLTLFKAIKGIWVKDINQRIYYVGSPYLCYAENEKRGLQLQFRVADTWYAAKDYGKTWALTKEELENDK